MAWAEHSLAENHRVRGELKVMLAKAELARVEGTPGHRFVKKWSMRILPALAAIFLAGGGYALWQVQLPRNAAVTAPVETAPPAASVQQETEAAPLPDETPAEEPVPEPLQPSQEPVQEPPVETAPAKAPQREERASQAERPPAKPAAPRVPDDGMQKLMQTAGKALRK